MVGVTVVAAIVGRALRLHRLQIAMQIAMDRREKVGRVGGGRRGEGGGRGGGGPTHQTIVTINANNLGRLGEVNLLAPVARDHHDLVTAHHARQRDAVVAVRADRPRPHLLIAGHINVLGAGGADEEREEDEDGRRRVICHGLRIIIRL